MAKANELSNEEKILWGTLTVLGGAALYWVVANSRFFTPHVPYVVRRREGAFELRDYPDLAVVETPQENNGAAFNLLFNYIKGENSLRRKIPMIAPVLINKAVEREKMSFVMPDDVAPPPEPRHAALEVNVLPARRYAALRFQGWPRRANERKAIAVLRARLIDRQLPASADPIIAYYDPPWMPPPLRRNEVLIEIPR